MKEYIVIIKEEYVRDSQVCLNSDEDIWGDLSPKPFLGIFSADNEDEALKTASTSTGFPCSIIEAILIKSGSSNSTKEQTIPNGQTDIYDYIKE